MRRVFLVAAFTALLPGLSVVGALSAEENSDLAPSPDTLAAAATPAGSLRVTLTKNGNVRFAPTIQSKVIVTLPARSEVEILGAAKVAGWYVIRFPHEGNAWVHGKVLKALDGGKRWRVIEDKARARDDSTLRSEIVAELNKGEVLEDKGRQNGDWRAVYLPNAVAYIHESVLAMPSDMEKARGDARQRAQESAGTWASAQNIYAGYYDALQQNAQNALVLDWEGLAKQFDIVIRDHADADVRMSAQRLRDGIVNVASAAANLQKAKGLTPVRTPGEIQAVAQVRSTQQVAAPTQSGATKSSQPSVDPLAPPLLAMPDDQPTLAVPIPPSEIAPLAPIQPAVAASKASAAEGFVTQQKFDAIGVNEVLVDGDSNVVAFLKVQVGRDIQLSEYYWRWVAVRGEVQHVDQAKHNLGRDIPLVIIDDLSLGR